MNDIERPEPDSVPPEPDSVPPEPDSVTPEPDSVPPEPDPVTPAPADQGLLPNGQAPETADLPANAESERAEAEPVAMDTAKRGRRRSRLLWLGALGLVVLAGAALRLQGPDWDDGQNLHPDERFLTMVESSIDLPQDLLGYFDTDNSPLNPRNGPNTFFVYGTWPITLVQVAATALERISPPLPPEAGDFAGPSDSGKRALAWLATGKADWPPAFGDYAHVYLLGRRIVAYLDVLAILGLAALAYRLYGRREALLAATLGAFTAFHIQQSHFFTVDAPANFFVVVCLVGLAGLSRGKRWWDPILGGVGMGLALASKISVWPLVPLAIVAAISGYAPAFGASAAAARGKSWLRVAIAVLVVGISAFATLRLAQPDMWAGPGWPNVVENIDRYSTVTMEAPSWWHKIHDLMPDELEPTLLPDPRWAANMAKIQTQITGHGMDWPPNHQWFGRLAYLFPWKNMVLWGMGLALGLTAWAAWAAAAVGLVRGDRRHIVPWLWVAMAFAYYGVQWAKTMRYYLPLYPALIALAAWGLVAWLDKARAHARSTDERRIRRIALSPALASATIAIVVAGTAAWGLMVANIYQRDHSRVAGTRWIYHHVPAGFSLQVAEGDSSGWEYLPLSAPSSIEMTTAAEGTTAGRHEYVLHENRVHDPARVIVPGDRPVTVDGLRLTNLSDPAGDASPETITAEIVDNPYPTEENVLTRGKVEAALDRAPSDVLIPFQPIELEPGGEYYVRIGVEGAPVAGRLPILGLETRWDDVIPRGIDGYAAFDEAISSWAEGAYGSHMFEMFGEDEPSKVSEIVDGLAGTDYLVLSSNRVYGSIAQLPTRYPMTNRFYDLLFSGGAGYDHIAEITSYPGIGPIRVPDQSAEEAWHVYDHPRVDVFRRSPSYNPEALRAELTPLTDPSVRTWVWPAASGGGLLSRIMGGASGGAPEVPERRPITDVMLSAARVGAQRAAGTWSAIFDPESAVNSNPALAVVLWYLVLTLLGVLAFPIVALALGDFADRGWSVSRTAGLLMVSWLAWLVASTGRVPHSAALLWAAVVAVGLLGALVAVKAGRNRDLVRWCRVNWRLIAFEEAVFLALFAFFLVVRMGNPDLWHPWYGGEKPMDLAYLNAVLRTRSFPPYDPWFAGGMLNYYYYGFVFIGALMRLTGIVPWISYNLAIPSLAALTGTGVLGITYSWSVRYGRRPRIAAGAGVLAATLAVVAGNLHQVKMITAQLATLGHVLAASAIPGFETLQRAFTGWLEVAQGKAVLGLPTGHWYWNASRAIVPPTDQPITEFPFFTFLYADLHAHMMALPITVLALAAALSWPLSWSDRWNGFQVARGAARLFLAALAIGALWPTNTWDFPTYGLVAAGAIAVAHWGRRPRISLAWLIAVATKGLMLLGLALLLFLPYHLNYVQPYGDFSLWKGSRTGVGDYLTVHGIALFAIASWVLWRAIAASELEAHLQGGRRRIAALFLVLGLTGAWLASRANLVGLVAFVVAAGGLVLLLRRRAAPHDRFAGWIVFLAITLTLFVEYVVLAGDIGRMNTVFKFYIQVWILFAVVAGVAAAWLAPHLARLRWGGAWWGVFAILVASGLVYTLTATRGKWMDRFPVMAQLSPEERTEYEARWRPGLSGIEYEDYARYDDDGFILTLADDADGIRWMQENVQGTPVILEGFRDKGYRWGSRYSIQTGLPTVIGWDWHQIQQKNAVGAEVVQQRTADVKEMYDTADLGRARELLDKYLVEYVVVGEMERAFYNPEGLAKFDRMVDAGDAEVAYRHPDSPLVIYRILRDEPLAGRIPGVEDDLTP